MPVVGPMMPLDPEWPIDEGGIHFGLQGMWK